VNGDKQVYLKVTSDLGTATGDVYLFDHNITWTEGTSITGELFVKNDVDLSNGANSLIIDLESDVSIINPKQNNGMFDFVIDYDKDGVFDSNDKVVSLTVRDTVANDAPNVGYINIASRGFNHDNHYTHSDNLSDYGYIDEFKKDGSNTHYGCCGSTKGVKVIWNPYIKNITKSGGYFTNAGYPNSGSVTTYVDQNSVEQESPFNYGQRINIYIIDAEVNKLKANLELDNIDVRGYGSTHTVQYSCSNGAGQQTIWRPNMDVGKYYLILDMDMDGKITEGVDFIDAVDQTGKKITEDSSVVGFSVID
ncbi:MAG: hypothetical protein U9Q20_05800, partial [Campylobacterota bacterium]|nr:hypothetical protein [Campylobacterota bacterium]